MIFVDVQQSDTVTDTVQHSARFRSSLLLFLAKRCDFMLHLFTNGLLYFYKHFIRGGEKDSKESIKGVDFKRRPIILPSTWHIKKCKTCKVPVNCWSRIITCEGDPPCSVHQVPGHLSLPSLSNSPTPPLRRTSIGFLTAAHNWAHPYTPSSTIHKLRPNLTFVHCTACLGLNCLRHLKVDLWKVSTFKGAGM